MKSTKLYFSLIICLLVQISFAQQFIQSQDDANIDHVFNQVNFNGGGVAFVDIDNDGDDDAYLVGGNLGDRLFVNDGTGSFIEITETAGISVADDYYTTGVNYGDIDNDGDEDIYVNTYFPTEDQTKYARNLLFRNNGDLTFTEIWADGVAKDKSMTMGSTFIDYDNDGDLDIYNVNYVKIIKFTYDDDGNINGFDHTCFANYLYKNNGDGSFTAAPPSIGLNDTGCALAVTATDYDNDGDMDLLVGNDFGPFIQPNKLFRNDFNETGKFTEVGAVLGADQEMFSMGIAIGDYDNDLDLDYYVSNLGKNVFLEQDAGSFTDVAQSTGTENEFSGYNASLSVSWGNLFADIDNDMDLDLFVANGYVPAPAFVDNSTLDPDRLFINNGDKTFTEADSTSGISNELVSRGCAYSDIDMDGKLDILSIVYNKPGFGLEPISCLFKNAIDNDNNWVKFKLEGTTTNRSAYGAKIYVYTGNDVRMAELNGGASFCSHNSSFMHFGIGEHESVDSVKIIWPGGEIVQVEKSIEINTTNYIKEGVSTNVLGPDSETHITVSPNPSEAIFHIQGIEKWGPVKVNIYDFRGKHILTSDKSSFDLSEFSSGTYVAKIILGDGKIITKKISKL